VSDHPVPSGAPASPAAEPIPPSAPVEGRGTTLLWLGLLLIGVLSIAILVALQIREAVTPRFTTTPIPGISAIDPRPLLDFTLPASTGGPVTFSSLGADGRYTLVFFGYTHCPDFCPLTLAEFVQIKDGLGELANRMNFAMVSVDPARDTPEFLAQYLRSFDPSFIGFSGDDVTLARISPDFGLFYERYDEDGATNYLVDHSTPSYLIDPQMNLRAIFSYSAEMNDVTEHIRSVLMGN